MNMIEKIARAMHNKSVAFGARVPANYDDVEQTNKDHFIIVIRAGLEAMREPTEEMKKELHISGFGWLEIDNFIKIMIDAALKE